jgi:hypothetical protein
MDIEENQRSLSTKEKINVGLHPEYNNKKLKVNIPLFFSYRPLKPETTDILDQNEMRIVSAQDKKPYIVSGPFQPCSWISVWNDTEKKGIVFHKYGKNQFNKKAEENIGKIGAPGLLTVHIYSNLLPVDFFNSNFKETIYQGRSQTEDTESTVLFFKNMDIAEKDIHQFMYELPSDLSVKKLGLYEDVHTTIGLDKRTGKLFHTSFIAENLYDIPNVPFKDGKKVALTRFQKLPMEIRRNIFAQIEPVRYQKVIEEMYTNVETYKTNPTLDFFDSPVTHGSITFHETRVVIDGYKYVSPN